MRGDTIRRRTQKLKLKKENENGFHARLVEWIEDHNLHGSVLIQVKSGEMCKYHTANAMIFSRLINATLIKLLVFLRGRRVHYSFFLTVIHAWLPIRPCSLIEFFKKEMMDLTAGGQAICHVCCSFCILKPCIGRRCLIHLTGILSPPSHVWIDGAWKRAINVPQSNGFSFPSSIFFFFFK